MACAFDHYRRQQRQASPLAQAQHTIVQHKRQLQAVRDARMEAYIGAKEHPDRPIYNESIAVLNAVETQVIAKATGLLNALHAAQAQVKQ
jgi:hypothetical protein